MAKAKSKLRVNVILDAEDHARLVDYCEKEGHKKSTLIARVMREFLDGLPKAAAPRRTPRAQARPAPPRRKDRRK